MSSARRAGSRVIALSLLCTLFVACKDVQHNVGTIAQPGVVGGHSGAAVGGAGASGAPSRAGTSGGLGGSSGSTTVAGSGTAGDDFDLDAALPEPVPGCGKAIPTVSKRLDLYFMIDTNITIPLLGAWDLVKEGIGLYLDDPAAAGTGLGMDVYGLAGCEAADYSMPTTVVGTDPLPANSAAIRGALNPPVGFPAISSPMGAALEGAVSYARSRAFAYPDRTVAVVLFSDGFIDFTCPYNPDRATQAASSGLEAGARSFVVELAATGQLPLPATLIPLDPVAAAGGTDVARTVDLSSDQARDIAELLLGIQHDADPCEYAKPEAAAWDEAQLTIDTGTGPRPLAWLNGVSECTPMGGVYLDTVMGIEWAHACPASCRAIHASGHAPGWLIGCELSQ